MRAMVSGTLRFDRRSIPAELSDISQWPTADDSGLDGDARSLFARRIQAMTLFVDGSTSLRAIGSETGLRINDLYRLFERCITRHEDGRIYGCRALLPWLHTQPYERSATVKASGAGGASGAFAQLLQRYPDIARWIERKVAARSRPHATLEEVPRHIWRLHGGFLAQCRQAGIPPHEYPFNQKHLGERSLARHVKRLAGRRFAAAARAAGAQQIDHAWQADYAAYNVAYFALLRLSRSNFRCREPAVADRHGTRRRSRPCGFLRA